MTAPEKEITNWSWLRKMHPKIFEVDSAPLLGNTPDFPLEQLSKEMSKTFQKDFYLEKDTLSWEDTVKTKGYLQIACSISGLEGNAFLLLQEQDFLTIMSYILDRPLAEIKEIRSDIVQGFTRFCMASLTQLVNELGYQEGLAFSLDTVSKTVPENTPLLCQKLWITLKKESPLRIQCTVVIEPQLHTSWKSYSIKKYPSSEDRLASISVPVHLEAGRTFITLEELQTCQIGDCILLDESFFFPDSEFQELVLSISDKPFCRAKVHPDKLEIIKRPS